jgi:hypothetical protein
MSRLHERLFCAGARTDSTAPPPYDEEETKACITRFLEQQGDYEFVFEGNAPRRELQLCLLVCLTSSAWIAVFLQQETITDLYWLVMLPVITAVPSAVF